MEVYMTEIATWIYDVFDERQNKYSEYQFINASEEMHITSILV